MYVRENVFNVREATDRKQNHSVEKSFEIAFITSIKRLNKDTCPRSEYYYIRMKLRLNIKMDDFSKFLPPK